MSEVTDGASILHDHVHELRLIGVIDETTAESLTEDINDLQRTLERFYDEAASAADNGEPTVGDADACITGNNGHPRAAIEYDPSDLAGVTGDPTDEVYVVGTCRDCGADVELQFGTPTITPL